MKWQNKLTKKELSHVRYATKGHTTLEEFKHTRQAQLKIQPKYGMCLDCWMIAKKLGIEK